MIDISLIYVRQMLDQYLVSALGAERSVVVLDQLSATGSGESEKRRNKIVITLVNLEYETNRQFQGGQRQDGGRISEVNPAIYFNLDILVSANFDDYEESLKFLTACIGFFQENLALNRATNPAMPAGINTLKFEIENSGSEKTRNIWTALGVPYLPSMIYKIRHIAVQSGQVKGSSAMIADISSKVAP